MCGPPLPRPPPRNTPPLTPHPPHPLHPPHPHHSTYYVLDTFAGWYPKSRVVGAPDAGFFLDLFNVYYNTTWFSNCYRAADPVWNSTTAGTLNAGCLAAFPGQEWKCFLQVRTVAARVCPALYVCPALHAPCSRRVLRVGGGFGTHVRRSFRARSPVHRVQLLHVPPPPHTHTHTNTHKHTQTRV
jgi:hypothetical protein